MGDQGHVDTVIVEDLKNKEVKELKTDGVFVFAGFTPSLQGIEGVELDEYGYIKVDQDMQTNLPGVFAIGDVRSKKIRQITTAVSDGTIAAISAERIMERE